VNVLNWTVIISNLGEAIEQLAEIEHQLERGALPTPEQFEVQIQHAFHHLNFAWNARYVSTEVFSRLTDQQFHEWGAYPTDLETL